MFKKVNIICGHYGCGKTNLSVNLALKLRETGEQVTIVDMDVVNPYFRTSDYKNLLIEKGIKVVCPVSAGSTLDSPFLSPEIYTAINQKNGYVIIDCGGDDVGATALGMYDKNLKNIDYKCFYVVNKYRNLASKPEEAIQIMREIESACKLKMDAVINNSNLSYLTKCEDIINSIDFANKVCEIAQLPLVATTVPKQLKDELENKVPKIFPVDVIVKLPWLEEGDVCNGKGNY